MSYKLHKEGNPYLISAVFFLLASFILAYFFTSAATVFLFSLSIFFLILFLIFFRNPPRFSKEGLDGVLAPADGKVVVIEKTTENEFLKKECIQVSIFMSPLNVHSNRSPVEGKVIYQKYHSGDYLVAWHPKSSELNERNTVVIEHKNVHLLVRQIAGKVARKIVSYVKEGDTLKQGEEFGFIKFGSRVDVFLPADTIISAKIGDVVKGGVTEIAKLVVIEPILE
jgi:phosphatidylserine decarboxylase